MKVDVRVVNSESVAGAMKALVLCAWRGGVWSELVTCFGVFGRIVFKDHDAVFRSLGYFRVWTFAGVVL